MNKYFMAVQDGKVLDILIFGDITSWEWYESDVSSYTLARLIQNSDAETIKVRINSYGGEVAEALAIYNSLKNHPARVITECDGFACSAASIVFMAGDERIMNKFSLLMIHNAWSHAMGNAKELRKAAEDLEKISAAAAGTYREVMTISEEDLEKLLDEETWILPEDALAYGFATSVMTSASEAAVAQYSARTKVFEQLAHKKSKVVEEAAKTPPAQTRFNGLFDKFIQKEGERE